MGGTQRLEVIILAVLIVFGMGVGALIMLVRSPTPIYIQYQPQPLGQSVPTALAVPSAMPIATIAPTAVSPTIVEPAAAMPLVDVQPFVLPVGLGIAGIVAMALIGYLYRRQRNSRAMPHVNQSLSMLFRHASPEARDSNLRVMSDLANKGLLPAEMHGVIRKHGRFPTMRFPSVRFPTLRLPSVKLPSFSFPTLRFPEITPPTISLPKLPASGQRPAKSEMHLELTPAFAFAPLLTQVHEPAPLAESTATMQTVESWTPEDRVLVVATGLEAMWTQLNLSSELLAFDAASGRGQNTVTVWIDPAPGEEEILVALPAHITASHPAWHVRWREDALDIRIHADEVLPLNGPLLLPIIEHRQRGERIRFLHLRPWQHLAAIGPNAHAAINGLLVNLLYGHNPTTLAIAITDTFPTQRLFTRVPHYTQLPTQAIVPMISEALRKSRDQWQTLRRVVIVIANPEPATVPDLVQLIQRLRGQIDIPVSLFLSLTEVRSCDREILALLPALLVGVGNESATAWLPGGQWPRAGAARFVGRTMRLDGKALLVEEAELANVIGPLANTQPSPHLPFVLWQAQVSMSEDFPPSSIDDTPIPDAENAPGKEVRVVEEAPEENIEVAPVLESITQPDTAVVQPEPLPTTAHIEPNNAEQELPQEPPQEAPHVAFRSTSLLQSVVFGGQRRERPTYATPVTSNASNNSSAASFEDTIPLSVEISEQPSTPSSKWPIGPFDMQPNDVGRLIVLMLNDPAFTSDREDQMGVSKSRMIKGEARQCLPRANADMAARFFLVWCEAAELFQPATNPERRFRNFRRFLVTDIDVIAQKLHATALPSKSAVDTAFGE